MKEVINRLDLLNV